MISHSYWIRLQQKEESAEQMHHLMQESFAMQSRMQERDVKAISSIKGLHPKLYLSGTEIPDSIKSCLRGSAIDFLIIADPYFIPLTSYPEQTTAIYSLLPENRNIFQKDTTKSEKIATFYGWADNNLYRFSSLEMQWTDNLSNVKRNAYLFFGHRYNPQELDELGKLIGGEASLLKEPSGTIIPTSGNEIIKRIPLYGTLSYPIASIQLKASSPLLASTLKHNLMMVLWGIAGMSLLVLTIIYFVRKHYLLPIRQLKAVLITNDPDKFDKKTWRDADYEVVKNQLLNFFSQQHLLSELIKRQPLEKTLELHSTILDQINEVVYVTNVDDKIVFWNQAAEKYYSVPQQLALNQTAATLVPLIWETQAESNKITEMLNQQGCVEGKFIQNMPSGETRHVLMHIRQLFDCTNRPTGNLYILNG